MLLFFKANQQKMILVLLKTKPYKNKFKVPLGLLQATLGTLGTGRITLSPIDSQDS